MIAEPSAAHVQRTKTADLMVALGGIIDALGRLGPQVERAGEVRIARDARALRREAMVRRGELQQTDSGGYDEGLVEAIMTDDGGA
jgi:hypothetical protein